MVERAYRQRRGAKLETVSEKDATANREDRERRRTGRGEWCRCKAAEWIGEIIDCQASSSSSSPTAAD